MKFSLPSINFKSESPQLYSFLKKVKEVIELREGIYGVSDSFVTREELKSLGPGDIGGGGGVGEGGNAWVPEGLTSLNPPKNLKLDRLGIFYTIVLSWDNAENHTGVEGTEIWCSYTNNKSDAFRVGLVAFPEKEFVFVPENVAHDYYFWIRHIGNGLYSPWEPSNVQGGYVVTSESLIAITVKELLEKLKGNIHEDLLAQDVISLINSSSMEVRPFDAQTKWIKGDWVCSNQKIYKCLKNIVSLPCPTPPSDEFWKLIGEGDAITDIIDGNVFAIKDSLAKIKKQEDSITLISQDITALQSSIEDTEENISANANAISSLNTTVTNQAGEISAHSSSINSVSTTVGNHTASIQQLSQSVNGLNAQYTLKVNANGHVAGIGLAANSDVSEMVLVADKFKIINPAQPGVPAKQPFTISTIEGKTFIGIDGNLLVAGDKTFMKDGYINTEILQINDKMIVGRLSKNKLDSSLETQSGASSKANNAESNSKSYTRGWCQQGADKTQTALNNGADISRARANGYTLIDGGYIRTGLITASNIRTGILQSHDGKIQLNLNNSAEGLKIKAGGALKLDGLDGGKLEIVEGNTSIISLYGKKGNGGSGIFAPDYFFIKGHKKSNYYPRWEVMDFSRFNMKSHYDGVGSFSDFTMQGQFNNGNISLTSISEESLRQIAIGDDYIQLIVAGISYQFKKDGIYINHKKKIAA